MTSDTCSLGTRIMGSVWGNEGNAMRKVALVLLSIAAAVSHAAGPGAPRVYLDRPGALDAVERANPEHYRRITEILNLATEMPCHEEKFSRELAVKYEATSGGCGLVLMTSYPPKRQLSFTLGETIYMVNVTMSDSVGRFFPVTSPPLQWDQLDPSAVERAARKAHSKSPFGAVPPERGTLTPYFEANGN